MPRPRFLVWSFVMLAVLLIWVLQVNAVDRAIRLGGVRFEPEDGYHAAGIARDEPFVLQFYELPDSSQIEGLRARGVTLDRYAGGGAYIVRCDGSCAPWLAADASVRATVELSPAMKRSPVFDTGADDGYTVASGTSLSAPVVSGTAAVLSDYSSRRHGFVPTSLELKNLLIHSARDLGNPGPDYAYGHGLVDAELAARVLGAASFVPHTSHRTGGRRRAGTAQTSTRISPPAAEQLTSADRIVSLMLSGELDQGESHSFRFSVPHGSSELRATLAWHDPPGAILVNDLDLWLGSPYGDLGRPFVLDPENPTHAASLGRNEIDNVESVLVENPMPASWKVVVEGTRVAMAPERYSLIVSASAGNRPLALQPEGECEVLEFYMTIDDEDAQTIRPWSTFRTGDPLNMYLAFSVPENADYGTYFGSLTVVGSITNQVGQEVYRIAVDTHELPAVEFWEEVGSGLEIPEGLPVGPYTARVALRMHNGAECSSEYAFSVQ